MLAAAIAAARPCAAAAQSFPATTQTAGGIDTRIRNELAAQGTLDALAAELNAADRSDPAVLEASARVALEQGELKPALKALLAVARSQPNDALLLRRVASVEEKLGQTGSAQDALRAALKLPDDPAARVEARLRLALLACDDGHADEGMRQLEAAVAEAPSAAQRAGTLAYLVGQYATAGRLLGRVSAAGPQVDLLRGNAALRAGNAADAEADFSVALAGVTEPGDRRYAQERVVAAARAAGNLSDLTAKWLADPDLPPDATLALARVLRETGRVPELLARCRQEAADPARAAMILTPRLMDEVIGGAREAGLSDQAEALAGDWLAARPDDEPSLAMVVRMLLDDGKPAAADTLLATRTAVAAGKPDALRQLARLARSLGRDDAAIAAARAMQATGGGGAVSGLLLEASVRLRAGHTAPGLALLHAAAAAADRLPAVLPEVAAALESAGQNADAITLLRTSVSRAPDDATLERLAALLVGQSRYAEAVPFLQTLRASGSTPAMRAQAGQRLLDVAAAQLTTAALIADTRKRVDAGTATEADLTLLVDAYTRTNDPAAAADVLRNNKLLDRTTTLLRLAVFYLRSGDLDAASNALRELVTADPDNAVGTLERLASVELDRKQPQAAAAVIDQIADRIGRHSPSFDGMMGGIYDRLNRPVPAALFYRRVLANRPEDADVWLLWATASAKAGRPERAIGRLLVLCDEARGENVFSVAVDGLLNLKASPAALRAARRDALLRVAGVSHASMLFQVVADLADELQDGDGVARALDVSVVFDREARPQVLRELMESAGSRGSLDEANAYGLSMLALGDGFPPETLIRLGEQLVVAGRLQDATRAFTRAGEIGSEDHVAPRVADIFEQYGHAVRALRVLSPVARRNPNDLSFQQDVARLSELAGQTAAAFDAYRRCVDLADRELAALSADPAPRDAVAPPRPDLTGLVNGAIATARTPDQKQSLLDTLRTRVDRELDATPGGTNPTPLFFQWLAEWRRACVALGHVDAMDREDDAIIGRRPGSSAFVDGSMTARLESGLFDAASRFARAHDAERLLPSGLRLGLPDASLPADASAADVTLTLPRLLLLGRPEQARRLLQDVPMVLPARASEDVPILIAVAVTLGEAELATRWAELWARQIVEPTPPAGSPAPPPATASARAAARSIGSPMQQLQDLVRGVWPVLPAEARVEVVRQALALNAQVTGKPVAAQATTLVLQLAAAAGVELPRPVDLALGLSPDGTPRGAARLSVTEAVRRFGLLPRLARPEFVSRAIGQLPPESGLAFLEQLVAEMPGPFDVATDARIVVAADLLPAQQNLIWSTWFTSTAHPALLPLLATARLRAMTPDASGDIDIASATAAAVALTRDAPLQASSVATEAIRAQLAAAADATPDEPSRTSSPSTKPATATPAGPRAAPHGVARLTLARYAATALDPAARSRLLEAFDDQAKEHAIAPTRHAWLLALRSILLDAAGRREAATVALRQAYLARSDVAEIRDAWVARMTQDTRAAEFAGTFVVTSPLVPRSVREPLAATLQSLFRGAEVPLPAKSVGLSAVTPRRVFDFMTPRATGDRAKLAETLRAFLERMRTHADGLSPIIQADPGGQPTPDDRAGNTPLFSDVGAWPGAVDDLLATYSTLRRGTLAADEVQDILVRAVADPAAATKVIDRLTAARQSDALTTGDRLLIERLAVEPGIKLPSGLLDEIWKDLWFDPSGGAYVGKLFACLTAQGDSRADGLRRWAAVRSGVVINPSVSVIGARRPPGPPTPVTFSETAFANYVDSLLDAGRSEAAEHALAASRQSGQLSERQTSCAALWARTAAERGDVEAFGHRLDQYVTGLAWSQMTEPTRSTLDAALPVRPVPSSVRTRIAGVMEQAIDRAVARWPSDPNWTRSLAALGRWCHEQGLRAEADRLLDRAAALADAQGPGEHPLWVADLAFLLGHDDRGWAIEARLFDAGCLPAVRIPALVNHLNATGDTKAADRILNTAVTWCKEPTIAVHGRPATRPG